MERSNCTGITSDDASLEMGTDKRIFVWITAGGNELLNSFQLFTNIQMLNLFGNFRLSLFINYKYRIKKLENNIESSGEND